MAGAWTLTDDGEFILDPAYAEKSLEIKLKLTQNWCKFLTHELASCTGYTEEELYDEFMKRAQVKCDKPLEIVDSFIIEALEGSIWQ